MTTFDRAFIKAYTGDFGDATAAPEVAIAPPHTAPAKAATRRGGASAARAHMAHAQPERMASAPRPLSSFTPQPRIQPSWRAMLEVDTFQWPTACLELLDGVRGEWDRFCEHLIEGMGLGQKCIALSSGARGDGRTTVALALARHLSGRGLRPIVVDADFANPQLSQACGVSVHTGWDDLLASELALGEALISAVDDGVTLMPWRKALDAGKPFPASMKAGAVFGTLREHYDLTIVDLVPLDGQATIGEFAAFSTAIGLDSLYVVQNSGAPSHASLTTASARLRRAGVPLSGMIENFVVAGGHKWPHLHVDSATRSMAGHNTH